MVKTALLRYTWNMIEDKPMLRVHKQQDLRNLKSQKSSTVHSIH
jgi:hypothetical protein